MKKILLVLFLTLTLSACDKVVRQLGPKEVGVVFRRLPGILWGGLASGTSSQASKVFLWPWEDLITVDTTLKTVNLSSEGQNLVYTRAKDGTEVALKVLLSFQVIPTSEALHNLIERVGPNEEYLDSIVTTVARSEVRTRFSELDTWAFADVDKTEGAVAAVKGAMNKTLEPLGVEVLAVSLSGYQFERLRRDGTLDTRYQDALKTVRDLFEKTQSTKAGVETVKAKKRAEFEREQANYNQKLQQTQGLRDQAVNRAGNYLKMKQNVAAGIRAAGDAEIEGLRAQIDALAGPGGQALVKLDLVKAFLESAPKFIVIPQGTEKELQINKVDQNQLLEQMGIMEAFKPSKPVEKEK